MDRIELIQNSVIGDMSEGVMAISHKGVIELANAAALSILGKEESGLVGSSFARSFFADERNDEFTESVLEAIRNRRQRIERYIPYYAGDVEKRLRVVSSCLHDNGVMRGVVLVISDVTELYELRDSMRAMEQIRSLNGKLELRNKLLTETFGRYLSDDIVREILDTPDGMKMGGIRRRVTILMSDLRGFTMMCARTNPQDLVIMLNHYFEEMYAEISRFRGTIIEFLGDGMFILFGAPEESTDHASCAVACAIAMQNRMAGVNIWNAEHGYETLSMGIGINTGDVILGNIGSEKRTKYGVMGPEVNKAGRIESYTTGGMILISPSTMEAVPEELEIEESFPCMMKGLSEEILLSRIAGIGGEYGLRLSDVQDELIDLSTPVSAACRRMRGKMVGESAGSGEIIAVSGSQIVLILNEPCEIGEDLLLDVGMDLYVKVVGASCGRYTAAFTAKAEGFEGWLKGIAAEE